MIIVMMVYPYYLSRGGAFYSIRVFYMHAVLFNPFMPRVLVECYDIYERNVEMEHVADIVMPVYIAAVLFQTSWHRLLTPVRGSRGLGWG